MVKKLYKWYTILFCLYLCQFLIKSRDPLIHRKAKKASSLHSPMDPSQSDADCAESDGVHSQSARTEHSPRIPHGVRVKS